MRYQHLLPRLIRDSPGLYRHAGFVTRLSQSAFWENSHLPACSKMRGNTVDVGEISIPSRPQYKRYVKPAADATVPTNFSQLVLATPATVDDQYV